MKNYFAVLLFCLGFSATAQYYQDGSRHIGVDRSMTGQMHQSKKKKKSQPDREDLVELSVEKLTQELTLDSFQAAVIHQLLETNQKEEGKVITQDIPDESKVEKILLLREKMNDKIKEVLTPEQIDKLGKKSEKKKK